MEAENQSENNQGSSDDSAAERAAKKNKQSKDNTGSKENPKVFNDITQNPELLPYFG